MQKNNNDILTDLISFQTDGTNVKQHKSCVDYICKMLADNNILYEKIKCPNSKIENIFAAVNVKDLKNINNGVVLSGHYDVVTANENLWQTPPYKATILDQKIYGRGAVDMKYFIAVVLSLLPDLKSIGYPVFLLFTGDEETKVDGIKVLCAYLKQNQIFPQYAVVGEPTNFAVCTSHSGYCGYKTKIYGIAGHSSRPDSGTNAISVAAHFITELEKLNHEYMSYGTTINVGLIQGGSQRNNIPDEVFFDWEIRFSEQKHQTELVKKIQEIEKKLLKQYSKASINTYVQEILPPLEHKTGKLSIQAVKQSKTSAIQMQLATEAGFLQQCGMETIICGAGDDKVAHTSSEHISTDDILRYKKFLLTLLSELKNYGDIL